MTEPTINEFMNFEALSDAELLDAIEQTITASRRATGPAVDTFGRMLSAMRQERELRGYSTYDGFRAAVAVQVALAAGTIN